MIFFITKAKFRAGSFVLLALFFVINPCTAMLTLYKLYTYAKFSRRNSAKGTTELEALDVKQDNPLVEVRLSADRGYILKPGDVYVGEVSEYIPEEMREDNISPELTLLGVNIKVIGERFTLVVSRPVKIYMGTLIFLDNEENED